MFAKNLKITIAHLYPKLLNIYGDRGNIITLANRCKWRNIEVSLDYINTGDTIDANKYDIYFIGGGQDEQQILVANELQNQKEILHRAADANAVFLAICGGYQLLGKFYETAAGERLDFTGILDLYTCASEKRLIGNYEFKTAEKIRIIGFENHSGRTFLGSGVAPLGRVLKGFGNNGADKTEGARYKNTFCTYCHGPVLPKNPDFADMLIKTALERRYDEVELAPLDCSQELLARRQIRDLYI